MDRWRRRRVTAKSERVHDAAVRAHLDAFVATRTGVEAWIEPASGFNKDSLLLVAGNGEWTRRAVPSLEWAEQYARQTGLRSYPAGVVGYPQRMRDWDLAARAGGADERTESR